MFYFVRSCMRGYHILQSSYVYFRMQHSHTKSTKISTIRKYPAIRYYSVQLSSMIKHLRLFKGTNWNKNILLAFQCFTEHL